MLYKLYLKPDKDFNFSERGKDLRDCFRVTSRKNPFVTAIGELSSRAARRAEEKYLAEGEKLLLEAAALGKDIPEVIAEEKYFSTAEERLNKALPPETKIITCPMGIIEKLSASKTPPNVMFTVSTRGESFDFSCDRLAGCSFVLVCENIQDPGNAGALLRCANCFGVDMTVFLGGADALSQKAVRGSMGAVFAGKFMNCENAGELFSGLETAKFKTYAAVLSENAVTLDRVDISGKCAVFLGNEGRGLSKETADRCCNGLYIPMDAGESLNVSAAAAVILWEHYRRKISGEAGA